ncbi:SRPBCC family protein, partial [Maribacter arcticus]|nr:SRPBCC family protein [Maribacter arcticus]
MFIETPKAQVSKSKEDTFNFLNELSNFRQLMPENISKFEVLSENRFLFALKGMPEIVLEKKEQTQ